MNLANLIKNQRKQLSLSQTELARLADLSLPMIQNLESGNANPSVNTLRSIFEVLGLKFEVNFDGDVVNRFLEIFEGQKPDKDLQAKRYAILSHYFLQKAGTESKFSGTESWDSAKLALFAIGETVANLAFLKEGADSVLEKSDSVLKDEKEIWLSSGGLRKARSFAAKIF